MWFGVIWEKELLLQQNPGNFLEVSISFTANAEQCLAQKVCPNHMFDAEEKE